MAKLIKCPKCSAHIDVTSQKANATVKCPDCAAQMRVPTGETAEIAVSPKSGPGRMTPLFRKMQSTRMPGSTGRPPVRSALGMDPGVRGAAGSRGGGAALWIGLGVGLVALIAIFAVAFMNKEETAKKDKQAAAEKQRQADARASEARRKAQEDAAAEDAAAAAAAKGGPGATPAPTKLKRDESGKYTAPEKWQAGAKTWAKDTETLPPDEGAEQECKPLLQSGESAEVIKRPHRLLAVVVNNLLEDDERVGRNAFKILNEYCAANKITDSKGNAAIDMSLLNSAEYRGSAFTLWRDWFFKNKYQFPDSPTPQSTRDPNKEDWEALVTKLKGGGGFHDESRPQGVAFSIIKGYGKAAWPKIAHFLDHEDIGLAQAAAAALIELTGEKKPLPNEATKAGIKKSWLDWISTH